MDVIIPKNTVVPCKFTRKYPTMGDNQTKIALEILQGEAVRADACHKV